ncbi:haloacid dehalogenase-like hydrolase [Luteolibacter sp. GHJ8]|uniref:phosphoglycolate phosphatase n=1 Tax=Luteolibacter rhizosphaerae TaxID=2989719 RepID=A0ABT3FY22_9BACT|nr:HAD family hydrolase [Luteolibacter rhizosphaerae]MCW1912476.1 haloacid dehalogenase-like hydrolase [Luteolibacter rhizosphaerae]
MIDRVKAAKLWLFDIDGTLVDTGGAGMRALQEAAQECYGGEGPPLDLAGNTDLGVLAGILAHFDLPHGADEGERFFAAYLKRLEWNLAHGGYAGRVLPGAAALLEDLERRDGVTVGLLTGNIAEGAGAKMRHYGLDRHFGFGAYGCDHADRNLLGPVALERAALHAGRDFSPEETLVIGDTPKDIACAKAMGARCLAVATGKFSAEQLRACGAEMVVQGLDDPAILPAFGLQ